MVSSLDIERRRRSPLRMGFEDWWAVLRRVADQVAKDNLAIVASGVAFYAFLAVFPALAAGVSIYGLMSDPAEVMQQMEALSGILPFEALQVFGEQLARVSAQQQSTLGLGVIVGILVAIYSANKGMKALLRALSIVHEEREERGFLWLSALGLLLTLGGVVVGLVAMAGIVGVPLVIEQLHLPPDLGLLARALRWPMLAVVIVLGLGVLYRFGPDRDEPRWRWVSPGALVACALWLGASALFSWFVSNYAHYNETYGTAATFVVVLLWLQLTSFVILLGAELNAELEHYTSVDTTTGPDAPRGERGAYVADHIAPAPRRSA